MTTNGTTNPEAHHHAVIGSGKDFWLWDSRTGYDLTRPSSPNAPAISPRLTIQTTTSPIAIDPAKSALIIIDMQNYFLSPALGRSRGPGHEALDQLVEHAIPAARKAGVRIIWLNWGLSEQDISEMPPAVLRTFGFEGWDGNGPITVDKHGQVGETGGGKRKYRGMGSEMGRVLLDPHAGDEVDAGKLLMRDQWNTALYSPLDLIYEEGTRLEVKPDVWIHKNRLSGAWKDNSLTEFLANEGIRTLMFSGVNTDQCVGGTLQDCYSRGFDCILLNDGCGTSSPAFAQQTVEFNVANTHGFHTSCKAFADGVDRMK